eukprot:TRINITY_DN3704_c0_g3_i1.p1 TRINITY_DN3704_c0_g3~~TRINITY_DN3704_c0_g3_i1.p1  ORF type:complete len:406 (+),score=80.86 TRINITY_DN3704_c0_g3_i1:81-1220(+)
MAQCYTCSKTLNGSWNMTKQGTAHERTGRYLGITDGYFLYNDQPNWVYSYCFPCWQKQILGLAFVNSVPTAQQQQQYLNTQQQYSSLQQQFNSLQREHNSLRRENKALVQKFNSEQEQFAAWKEEKETLLKENTSLQEQLNALRTSHEDLTKSNNDLQREHTTLRQEHTTLQEEHASLQKKHATITEEHDALQQEYNIVTKEKLVFHDEIDTIYNNNGFTTFLNVTKGLSAEDKEIFKTNNFDLDQMPTYLKQEFVMISNNFTTKLYANFREIVTKQLNDIDNHLASVEKAISTTRKSLSEASTPAEVIQLSVAPLNVFLSQLQEKKAKWSKLQIEFRPSVNNNSSETSAPKITTNNESDNSPKAEEGSGDPQDSNLSQ